MNENLPYIPTGQEMEEQIPQFLKEDSWFDVDIGDDWLDPAESYEKPHWTLSYNDTPFAPLGGIHALTGQPGHGKTMTFTQIMVAILKGKYGNIRYELADEIPTPKVLYIDTEMEKGNTQLVNLRVYSLMGWTFGEYHPEFRVIMLRETEKAEDRWRKTLKAIWEARPTVCFIDGLLDVVSDFNKNDICQDLIYKCMKVASHYNISLWCLVHENPGSTKMVGHIGSILERKVTDALGTIKEKDDLTGEVTFTVKQKKARGKDMKDWKFKVVDDLNKFGIPQQTDGCDAEELQRDELTRLSEMIEQYITEGGVSMTKLQKLMKEGEKIGSTKAYNLIVKAESFGIIEKGVNNKYFFIGGENLAKEEELLAPGEEPDF